MASDAKTAPGGTGAAYRKGSRSAALVRVIAVETVVGSGTESDPNRVIKEYWSLSGELLAANDPEAMPFGQQPSRC